MVSHLSNYILIGTFYLRDDLTWIRIQLSTVSPEVMFIKQNKSEIRRSDPMDADIGYLLYQEW